MKNKRYFMLFIIFFLFSSCTLERPEEDEDIVEVRKVEIVEKIAEPQKNKTLTLSMGGSKNFNPLTNKDARLDKVLTLIFEKIIIIDEYQKTVPNIIDSYEFINNGEGIVLNVRNDVFWHDGEKFTVDDIAFSVSILQYAEDDVIYKENVANISSFSVDSEQNSIQINFKKTSSSNLFLLSFPVIPRHIYEGNLSSEEIIGNGAYKYSKKTNTKEYILEKNSRYFKGAPLIDFVKILVTPDEETNINAFDTGIIDVITTDIINRGRYRGDRETRMYSFPTNEYDFIGFNFENEIFNDLNMRKAIAHAIPKGEIVQSVYLDYAASAEVPFNPSAWYYESTIAKYNYDLALSTQLLTDAGYIKNSENLFADTSGEPIFFEILVNSENLERNNVAEILSARLSYVGIQTEISSLPFDEYLEKIENKDFDLLVGGYNFSAIPDLSFLFHSSNIITGTNIFSYSNEILDEKLDKVKNAKDEVVLLDTLSDLQIYMVDELPCISLVFKRVALLTDKFIYGEINPTEQDIFNNINEWFIYEEIEDVKNKDDIIKPANGTETVDDENSENSENISDTENTDE